MLLEFGADPNLCDGMGQTALHRACCRGWVEVVGELRGKGAKMGVRDREGNTGLHLAVEEGHVSFFVFCHFLLHRFLFFWLIVCFFFSPIFFLCVPRWK